MKKKVLIFPLDNNPYQHTLYSHINKEIIDYEYLILQSSSASLNLFFFYFYVLFYRIRGYSIFHIHWMRFSFPFKNSFFYNLSLLNTILSIIWLKLLGYKIIWTVHNIIPHEKVTSNDFFTLKFLVSVANCLIIHSENIKEEFKKLNLKPKKYKLIQMGMYNMYPNNVSSSTARNRLKIPKNAFVYLFFGKIRKYKGVEELLDIFEKLSKKYKDIQLIIVGENQDAEIDKTIIKQNNKFKNKLLYINRHIDDIDIQQYFKSANAAVFPFTNITTSSSVLVSFYFQLPIIAPFLGNIQSFPNDTGFYYDPNLNKGLEHAMISALNQKDQLYKFKDNIKKYNLNFSWRIAAVNTQKIYESI